MSPEDRAELVLALDHDVRQPKHSIEMALRTMRVLAADLRARKLEGDNLDSALSAMTRELASIQAAIRQVFDTQQDLFDAIQLESSITQPQCKTVLAGDLIERVIRATRGLAGGVEIRGAPSRLCFVSDERWLERILGNLVGNAIRHSRGTRVLIGARRRSSGIGFEVCDNGRGLSSEDVRRIFDPVRASRKSPLGPSAARSGLGLYNVNLFATKLGGKVECSSQSARGTRFLVTLPGPVGRAPSAPDIGEVAVAGDVRNKLVAILDDDLLSLRETARVFEKFGVEVYADHDPIRWLGVLTDLERMPDLILLDLFLGHQHGALYLEILRRKWNGRKVQVVLMADRSSHPIALDLARTAPVLEKPLSEDKFKLILSVLACKVPLPPSGVLE